MQLYCDCFSQRLEQGAAKGALDWLPVVVLLAVVTTGVVEFVPGLEVVEFTVAESGQKTNTKTANKQDTAPRDREKVDNPFNLC